MSLPTQSRSGTPCERGRDRMSCSPMPTDIPATLLNQMHEERRPLQMKPLPPKKEGLRWLERLRNFLLSRYEHSSRKNIGKRLSRFTKRFPSSGWSLPLRCFHHPTSGAARKDGIFICAN